MDIILKAFFDPALSLDLTLPSSTPREQTPVWLDKTHLYINLRVDIYSHQVYYVYSLSHPHMALSTPLQSKNG